MSTAPDDDTTSPAIRRTWTPHPVQAAIMASDARHRIAACGRRFGKTEMAAHEAFEAAWATPGAVVWWVAPTYKDANDLGFKKCLDIIPRACIDGSPKRSEPREIPLINGSVISFRSAEREDSLRGHGLTFLVIDEAGTVPDRAWAEELRPALMDTGGRLLAIGTPRGKNWFHEWFARGQDETVTHIQSWQAPTWANPHIPEAEIADTRQDMSIRAFEQEVEAKFIDEVGGVFSGVRDCIGDYDMEAYWDVLRGYEPPYTIGVDLARTQNWAVTIALDATGRMAAYERQRDVSWVRIQKTVEAVAERCAPHVCRVDATRDNKLVPDLNDAGVNVDPIRFTAQSKKDLIETLAVRIENQELQYPDIPQLVNELQLYEYDVTPAGNIRYGPPEGVHDDCVDALALAAKPRPMGEATW